MVAEAMLDGSDGPVGHRPAARDLARAYRRMVAASIRSEWQYRSAFVLTTVMQLLSTSLSFVMIAAVFVNVDELAGWSFAEVALLYGISSMAFNLADTFITQVEMAASHIREGTFDRFLLRPAPVMLQLCATEFAYRRINKVVQAIVVLVVSAVAVDVDWRPSTLAILSIAILGGACIYGSLWVLYCSAAFWTVSTSAFVYAAVTAGEIAGRYPLNVFRPGLRRVLTAIVPIGFVAYYPACLLLDREPALGGSPRVAFLAPVVAVVLAALAAAVWRAGIHRYQGTGS